MTNGKFCFTNSFWEQSRCDFPIDATFSAFFLSKALSDQLIDTDLIVFWRPGSKQLSSSLLTCFYSKRLEKWRERLFHLCVTHVFSLSRCRDDKNVVNYLFTFLFLFEVDQVAGWILMGPSVLYCINLTHKQVQAYSNMWATSIPFVFRVILFKIWNLPLI